MAEEIINSDGSRNWEANILLDNIKRLEQDSKQLTQWLDEARRNADFWCDKCTRVEQENKELKEKIIELSEEKGHLIVENNTLKESNQSLSMLGTDLASANETVRKEFFRADKNKDMWREKTEEYRSALEKIRDLCIHYENTNDKCITNCYAHFIVTDLIQDKINEVLNDN